MSSRQKGPHGKSVGAGGLTVSGAVLAETGLPSEGRIFSHRVLFPALRNKVMVVAHDRIHGNLIRAGRLAQAAGVAAIEAPAVFLIGCQEGGVFRF